MAWEIDELEAAQPSPAAVGDATPFSVLHSPVVFLASERRSSSRYCRAWRPTVWYVCPFAIQRRQGPGWLGEEKGGKTNALRKKNGQRKKEWNDQHWVAHHTPVLKRIPTHMSPPNP